MDSVTQFVLGAALGEATLKPVGGSNRNGGPQRFGLGAFLLGGLMGTLPDLDVLARPWLNGPQALGFHRGVTHSLFFCTLITPFLALLLERLLRDYGLSRRRWLIFVWLGLNTHWMLDSLTTYGTQVFLPFSDHPVSIGSIFIIDPLYTLPLLAGTLWSVWAGRGGRDPRPNGARLALLISTLYLLLTLGSKLVVMDRFVTSLESQGIAYNQIMSVASPFNSVLWFAYADSGEDVWIANSSLFDSKERRIDWQRVPKNADLFEDFGKGPAGKRLLWFSRGFFRLDFVDDKPVLIDLRFGRIKSWLRPIDPTGRDYIFCFGLMPESTKGPYEDFYRVCPEARITDFPFAL